MKTISVFCLLLYAKLTVEASINIEGFERGEVSFHCSHNLASKNHKYLCKDPCTANTDILATVKSGGRVKSERITLVDSGNGVFTVIFSQLQLSDSGKYWCAVNRPGFDTFTEVHVTVKEAVTTPAIPELSPTWTYISNSTQLTSGIDTIMTTNVTSAPNSTSEVEQNINTGDSTGTVWYVTVGLLAVALLTISVLLICFRKCRTNSKPQQQVCSNGTDLISADEREVISEYKKTDKEVSSMKKLSVRFSCTPRPKQCPPTSVSTAAECSVDQIYENICCSRGTTNSKHSAANVQEKHDITSAMCRTPLPPTVSERSCDGALGKRTNKPTATRNVTSKPKKSRTSNASACQTSSCRDSKEERPPSLWFGLNLSGTS